MKYILTDIDYNLLDLEITYTLGSSGEISQTILGQLYIKTDFDKEIDEELSEYDDVKELEIYIENLENERNTLTKGFEDNNEYAIKIKEIKDRVRKDLEDREIIFLKTKNNAIEKLEEYNKEKDIFIKYLGENPVFTTLITKITNNEYSILEKLKDGDLKNKIKILNDKYNGLPYQAMKNIEMAHEERMKLFNKTAKEIIDRMNIEVNELRKHIKVPEETLERLTFIKNELLTNNKEVEYIKKQTELVFKKYRMEVTYKINELERVIENIRKLYLSSTTDAAPQTFNINYSTHNRALSNYYYADLECYTSNSHSKVGELQSLRIEKELKGSYSTLEEVSTFLGYYSDISDIVRNRIIEKNDRIMKENTLRYLKNDVEDSMGILHETVKDFRTSVDVVSIVTNKMNTFVDKVSKAKEIVLNKINKIKGFFK